MEGDMMGGLSGRWDRASALMFLQPGPKGRLNLKHEKSRPIVPDVNSVPWELRIYLRFSVIS